MGETLDINEFEYVYNTIPRVGSAKWTWKALHPEDSSKYLAVKLHKKRYRDHDHAKRSEREFNAYYKLGETHFGEYIPTPHRLILEKGIVIGYSVEWFNGICADPYPWTHTRKVLALEHLRNLYVAGMSLIDLDIVVDVDAMQPHNWMINLETPKLMMAECDMLQGFIAQNWSFRSTFVNQLLDLGNHLQKYFSNIPSQTTFIDTI